MLLGGDGAEADVLSLQSVCIESSVVILCLHWKVSFPKNIFSKWRGIILAVFSYMQNGNNLRISFHAPMKLSGLKVQEKLQELNSYLGASLRQRIHLNISLRFIHQCAVE